MESTGRAPSETAPGLQLDDGRPQRVCLEKGRAELAEKTAKALLEIIDGRPESTSGKDRFRSAVVAIQLQILV